MKRLSVIIVTYHSEKDVYDCLASVWEYCDIERDELEVVVVDNSPESEPMFTKLRQLYGQDIVLIHNTHNGGYGQGNNVGIRVAAAPVVMIMNPDVRLCEPVFRECLSAFEHDGNLVLYGFTQRRGDGKLGRSTSWVSNVNPYIAEPLRYLTGRLNLFFPKYMFVTGACFLLRKESFVRAGMFDESIFMYGEEEDIHNRLLAVPAARMGYSGKLSYIHLHKEEEAYGDNAHKWMEQHLSTLLKINRRDGIPREKTIAWAIRRNNFSIWKEYLKFLLSRGSNRPRLDFYLSWKRTLKQKLATVNR